MDADIEHHKAVATWQVCLERHGDVFEPQSSPVPAWYLLGLVDVCRAGLGDLGPGCRPRPGVSGGPGIPSPLVSRAAE